MTSLKDKKYVFFDMDGLLIDTEGLYYETRRVTLEKYGFPFTKADNQHYIAKGFPNTLLRLQKLTGSKVLGQKVFNEAMDLYHKKVLAGAVELKKGANELLQFLNQQKIACYVTSSATRDLIFLNAEHAGISDYFTDFLSGDDVAHNKPAPDIYLHALELTHAKPEQAVIFEDAESGIKAALAAGIDVVVVPDLVQPGPELAQQAAAVLDNLAEAEELFV